jgi:hypothetical protein
LHTNAKTYFKYFLEKEIEMYCSTISIAEYCVKGSVDELPLKDVRVLPFNFFHAIVAGKFAEIAYSQRESKQLPNRTIILNDIKLFAQAHYESNISHFITSDGECSKIYNAIITGTLASFQIVNISHSLSSSIGELPFE